MKSVAPKSLHLASILTTCLTAALGGILLAGCWPPLTHIIFATILVITLLNSLVAKSANAAITTRVLLSIFWVWAIIITVELIDAIYYHMSDLHVAALQDGVVWFGGMFLCYLNPAAVIAALCHNDRTAAYDRVLGCVLCLANIGVAGVAVFTNVGIAWPPVAPYVWFSLTIISAVLLWMSVRATTEEQRTALDARRAKRAEKRAAKHAARQK